MVVWKLLRIVGVDLWVTHVSSMMVILRSCRSTALRPVTVRNEKRDPDYTANTSGIPI